MKKLVFFLFFVGCADLARVPSDQALGGGVATGVVVSKVAGTVKDSLTPHFLLQTRPAEICGLDDPDVVSCFIVPCAEEGDQCRKETPREQWIKENPKVLTLRTSSLISVKHFCEKNPEACDIHEGKYDGEKIVLIKDEK